MENNIQLTIDSWYKDYRKEKNIPAEEAASPNEILYFIAERDHVPAWKVSIAIDDVIRKLSSFMELVDQKQFIEIFGREHGYDLWPEFSSRYHLNILTFAMSLDKEDKESLIKYFLEPIIRKINKL